MTRAHLYRFPEAAIAALALYLFALPMASQAVAALRVVDGDTIVLNGETIRLDGIDAPELGQKCLDSSGNSYRCGAKSRKYLERLTAKGDVRCEGANKDGYGRRIAACFAGPTNINQEMVRQGQAFAFRKYSKRYIFEEQEARAARNGFWSGWAEAPWVYRAAKWQVAGQSAPDGCPIKGNISARGKIYHPPWSPSYARTRIDVSKGERWFCSEAEAKNAGWRSFGNK